MEDYKPISDPLKCETPIEGIGGYSRKKEKITIARWITDKKQGEYEMVNVIASIHVKEGRLSEFVDIFKKNIPNVLEEEGCIEYMATIDIPTGIPIQELNENVVTIIEKWEGVTALDAHLSASHMLEYQDKVKDMVEKVSLKVLTEA